jgi:hypothetical protein
LDRAVRSGIAKGLDEYTILSYIRCAFDVLQLADEWSVVASHANIWAEGKESEFEICVDFPAIVVV